MDSTIFYSSQSIFTDPGKNAQMLDGIPKSVSEICALVQGLCNEYSSIFKYPIQNERNLETELRYMDEILDEFLLIDKNGIVTAKRAEDKRLMANISQYANIGLAMARYNGIPARKRVGFIKKGEHLFYYNPPVTNPLITYEIIEYLDGDSKEWKSADPFGSGCEFIPAAKAFADWRNNEADAEQFINVDEKGFHVLLENLMLDLAALTKHEMLTWDRFGWMLKPVHDFNENNWEVLDTVAALLISADFDLDSILPLYNREKGLQVVSEVFVDTPVVPPHKVLLREIN